MSIRSIKAQIIDNIIIRGTFDGALHGAKADQSVLKDELAAETEVPTSDPLPVRQRYY